MERARDAAIETLTAEGVKKSEGIARKLLGASGVEGVGRD